MFHRFLNNPRENRFFNLVSTSITLTIRAPQCLSQITIIHFSGLTNLQIAADEGTCVSVGIRDNLEPGLALGMDPLERDRGLERREAG